MNSSTILRENLRWRRNYSQRTVYYKNRNPITEMNFKLFSKNYLSNLRDDVMEEIDVLRVDHANDVTTIQELRMCLEDEKQGRVQ